MTRDEALAVVDELRMTECEHVPFVESKADCNRCIATALEAAADEGFSAGWKQGAHDKDLEWKTSDVVRRRRAQP